MSSRPATSRPGRRRPGGRGRGGETRPGAVTALNLVDDLDYRVYGLDPVPEAGGFFAGTLLPLARDDSAWLAAGGETVYPPGDGRRVARLAIDLATREPDLVFRNQEKAKQGWMYMRRDREEFVAFFGTDELVLPILEAEGRLNAYYKVRRDSALAARGRHRAVSESGETTFVMPEGFFEFDTVGIIYDELDGFVVVPEYGMLRAAVRRPVAGRGPRARQRAPGVPARGHYPAAAAAPDGGGLPRPRRRRFPACPRQPELQLGSERGRRCCASASPGITSRSRPPGWRCSATASWPCRGAAQR